MGHKADRDSPDWELLKQIEKLRERVETAERERDEYHAELDRLNELIMCRIGSSVRHMGDGLTHPDKWPACRECHDDWPCLPFYEELGAMLLRFDAAKRERDALVTALSDASIARQNAVQMATEEIDAARETRDAAIASREIILKRAESLEAQNAELRAVLEEILDLLDRIADLDVAPQEGQNA